MNRGEAWGAAAALQQVYSRHIDDQSVLGYASVFEEYPLDGEQVTKAIKSMSIDCEFPSHKMLHAHLRKVRRDNDARALPPPAQKAPPLSATKRHAQACAICAVRIQLGELDEHDDQMLQQAHWDTYTLSQADRLALAKRVKQSMDEENIRRAKLRAEYKRKFKNPRDRPWVADIQWFDIGGLLNAA